MIGHGSRSRDTSTAAPMWEGSTPRRGSTSPTTKTAGSSNPGPCPSSGTAGTPIDRPPAGRQCRRTVSGPGYTASGAGDLVLDCVKRSLSCGGKTPPSNRPRVMRELQSNRPAPWVFTRCEVICSDRFCHCVENQSGVIGGVATFPPTRTAVEASGRCQILASAQRSLQTKREGRFHHWAQNPNPIRSRGP